MPGKTYFESQTHTLRTNGGGTTTADDTIVTGWNNGTDYLEIPLYDSNFVADAVIDSGTSAPRFIGVADVRNLVVNLGTGTSLPAVWRLALIVVKPGQVAGFSAVPFSSWGIQATWSRIYPQGIQAGVDFPGAYFTYNPLDPTKLFLAIYKVSGTNGISVPIAAEVTYIDKTYKEY